MTVLTFPIIGGLEGIPALVSSLDPTIKDQLLRRCSAGPGDILLFAVGQHASVNKTLDRLRVYVAHELGLVDHVSFDPALQFEKINSLGFS